MTQEAIQQSKVDIDNSMNNANQNLQESIIKLRSKLNSRASNAKIIANIQECPCMTKCVYEMQNSHYTGIDSLYSAKHEYAKTKLIDAIRARFSTILTLSSEHATTNGKLDIALLPGSQILLKYNNKIIAIELKSGKWADAKMLFQLERYLLDCDVLIFVRVPTEEVTLIRKEMMSPSLIDTVNSLNSKVLDIIDGDRNKVRGEWCNGCNAECDFKKPSKWTNTSKPTLVDFAEFTKNINAVTGKLLDILDSELT